MRCNPKRPSEGPLVVVQVIGGYALLLLTDARGDTTRLVGYNDERPVEITELPCEDEPLISFSLHQA